MSEAPLVKLLFCDPSIRSLVWPDEKYSKPQQQTKEAPSNPRHRVPSADRVSEVPQSTIDKLRKLRDPKRKKAFDAIFEGKSFAEPGERDSMLQRVCSSLCWADEGKTTIEGLAEFLRPSLQAWADEPDAEKDVDEELEKAIEKLERASGDFAEFKTKQLAGLEGLRKVLMDGSDPSFKHLALQQDNVYYVYSFAEGRYWPPHTSREFMPIVRDAWPEDSPVELSYYNERGISKKKTQAMIIDEYVTVVRKVIYSLESTKTSYDPKSRTLRTPSAPRRDLSPVYHEQIDEWLQLIPRYKRHVPMLLDWVATSMLLDRMSAAIYLSGPKGIGKNLLVSGLARLWESGAASLLEHVLTRFNDTIMESPLIILDENWSGDNNINLCARLRELVGTKTYRVEQKGKCIVTIEGATRLIIAANNETTLNVRGNGDQNQMERDATIERILHVPTSQKASKFLLGVKNRDDWRGKNMIAEHALWLRDQRATDVIARAEDEGHRFLIQGDSTDAEFYDGIGSRPKDHDAALQWLSCLFTRAMLPAIRDKVLIEPARMGKPGKFRVVPRALCESWESYGLSKNFDTPTSSHRAKGILKPFLESDDRVKLNGANAYRINIERFVRIAKEEGLIKAEDLAKKLGIE